MNFEESRVKFFKIFSNLPEKVRNEDIIAVIDDKPYTWNVAYFEIKSNSEKGRKILNTLKELEII